MPTPRDVLGDVQLVDVTLWEGMGKGKGGGRAQLSSASISASLVFASPGFSSRYKSYVIPGETLIGGGSVSPWYWICLISNLDIPHSFYQSFHSFLIQSSGRNRQYIR